MKSSELTPVEAASTACFVASRKPREPRAQNNVAQTKSKMYFQLLLQKSRCSYDRVFAKCSSSSCHFWDVLQLGDDRGCCLTRVTVYFFFIYFFLQGANGMGEFFNRNISRPYCAIKWLTYHLNVGSNFDTVFSHQDCRCHFSQFSVQKMHFHSMSARVFPFLT